MEAAAAGCCLVRDSACVCLDMPVFVCVSRDLGKDACLGVIMCGRGDSCVYLFGRVFR